MVVHPYHEILFVNKNEWTHNLNGSQGNYDKWGGGISYILYDYLYNCLEIIKL